MRSFNHFGVYGIAVHGGKLLVIRKGRGAYTGRWDLPGGRLEANESLADGLVREFMEETGYKITVQNSLGAYDFFVRYQEKNFTYMHHLAALYTVNLIEQQPSTVGTFAEQDSLGAEWVDAAALNPDTASPVALLAAKYISGGELSVQAEYWPEWEVKD
ncbi:NUDIX hydrolase [Paenibacillus tengchongensis]|uniref:NUDIX hydrolase n=1 Tax=Paenibacillus tengchongensis TaxID=2608684 RepID=UPI00165249A3|nr:NUDIX hydrolase [Paenibacillus tengchongensis]